MKIEKTLRWFGPADSVSLAEIREAGATGVVTALHQVPNGEVWPVHLIQNTLNQIRQEGLSWHVVESLPVHHSIKSGSAGRDQHIANYLDSMRNLAACGIDTICYNFMPVLDWVRTDLNYALPGSGITMKYDHIIFAAFDLFILQRPGAERDYPPEIIQAAHEQYDRMTPEQAEELSQTIILVTQGFIDGFSANPGGDYRKEFLAYLSEYQHIDQQQLQHHLGYFLDRIIPEAERLGIKMAIHADDPAFPVLGLPRIVSTANDLAWIFQRHPSAANGLTFCTGSFSSNQTNDLPLLAATFRQRIHFLHLRNTRYINEHAFIESGHLEGDVDMVAVLKALMPEKRTIPMRPDHGLRILDDHRRKSNPGYPLIGRLKGLAEIAGLTTALLHLNNE